MSPEEEIPRVALAAFGDSPAPGKWDAWIAVVLASRAMLVKHIGEARRAYAFFLVEAAWEETAETMRRRAFLHALLAVRELLRVREGSGEP